MKLITQFDPSTNTSGTIDTKGVNANEQLMLYNDSIFGLQLLFPDGSIDIIPAQWNKDFIIDSVPMDKVTWSIYNQLNLGGTLPPISEVYGTIYEPGEHVARVNASMQRNVVAGIPQGVNIVSGTATAVQNDGKTVNTQFIESTVAAEGTSAVTVTNNGIMTLGNASHNGAIFINGNGSELSIQGFFSSDNGNIVTNGAGQVQLKSIAFAQGTFSRLSIFTGTSAAGKVTVNHGLGAIPDIVLLIFSGLSSTPVATTLGYNSATLSSTQVDVWASFAGVAFTGLAIKQ